jgi:hypothetical protein
MSDRQFRLRLHCGYEQPGNAVAHVMVQKQTQEGWEEFTLNTLSPGFEIFVYAVFTCQHTYFRTNCAEQGLLLAEAQGEIELVADADWNLVRSSVSFDARLLQGEAGEAVVNYIVERMRQCPVSRNIRDIPDNQTRISFGG